MNFLPRTNQTHRQLANFSDVFQKINTYKNTRETLKKAEKNVSASRDTGVFVQTDIDLVTNYYKNKIQQKYPHELAGSQRMLAINEEGEKKITQSVIKNDSPLIITTLSYLNNDRKSTNSKLNYLKNNFSRRALNILLNTLDKDIATISNPKEYNNLGIKHAVFNNNQEKITAVKELIKTAHEAIDNQRFLNNPNNAQK